MAAAGPRRVVGDYGGRVRVEHRCSAPAAASGLRSASELELLYTRSMPGFLACKAAHWGMFDRIQQAPYHRDPRHRRFRRAAEVCPGRGAGLGPPWRLTWPRPAGREFGPRPPWSSGTAGGFGGPSPKGYSDKSSTTFSAFSERLASGRSPWGDLSQHRTSSVACRLS